MSNKISLKIIVAGRTYPLHVHEHEVKKVEKAADDINKSIKLLQDNYAVKDMQDLLAMTALQLATKSSSTKQETSDYSDIEESLNDLLNEIENI
jgi:cell division protein ZapA (FtsZ GTPase activity inhibitor)